MESAFPFTKIAHEQKNSIRLLIDRLLTPLSLKHEEDGKFRYKIIREYPQTMLNEQKEKCTEKVNLVCFRSEKRARKDRADRERIKELHPLRLCAFARE